MACPSCLLPSILCCVSFKQAKDYQALQVISHQLASIVVMSTEISLLFVNLSLT